MENNKRSMVEIDHETRTLLKILAAKRGTSMKDLIRDLALKAESEELSPQEQTVTKQDT